MLNIWNNLDWSVLTDALMSVVPVLICLTLHECAHGYVALRLGDTTARDMGRLSLNPLKHFDIMGFVMMAFAGFGWAKPVPIDMRNFKNPKAGMAMTAAAGPAANVLISVLCLFLYGLFWRLSLRSQAGYYLVSGILRTAGMSLSFAVFNIIPIPPLDGSKVLYSFLSEDSYYKLMRYERYGMIILLVLVLSGAIDSTLGRAVDWALDKLWVFAELGDRLGNLF